MPRTSVIIPVRNDPVRLDKLLRSLSPADRAAHELIVVDDASTDGTRDVAASFDAKVVALDTRQGPSVARNVGAAAAAEEILVFVDSDVVLGAGALARLAAHLDDPRVAGVSTIASIEPENPGFVARYTAVTDHHVCVHWDAAQDTDAEITTCRWFSTRLGAIRRSLFDKLGGFDERFDRPCIEDAEFSVRLARHAELVLDRGVSHGHHWPSSALGVIRRVFDNARLLMTVLRERPPDQPAEVFSGGERVGRILAGLAVGSTPFAPFSVVGAVTAGLCYGGSAWVYRRLFADYLRVGGPAFALGSIAMHYVTTCAALAGAAVSLISVRGSTRVREENA